MDRAYAVRYPRLDDPPFVYVVEHERDRGVGQRRVGVEAHAPILGVLLGPAADRLHREHVTDAVGVAFVQQFVDDAMASGERAPAAVAFTAVVNASMLVIAPEMIDSRAPALNQRTAPRAVDARPVISRTAGCRAAPAPGRARWTQTPPAVRRRRLSLATYLSPLVLAWPPASDCCSTRVSASSFIGTPDTGQPQAGSVLERLHLQLPDDQPGPHVR